MQPLFQLQFVQVEGEAVAHWKTVISGEVVVSQFEVSAVVDEHHVLLLVSVVAVDPMLHQLLEVAVVVGVSPAHSEPRYCARLASRRSSDFDFLSFIFYFHISVLFVLYSTPLIV